MKYIQEPVSLASYVLHLKRKNVFLCASKFGKLIKPLTSPLRSCSWIPFDPIVCSESCPTLNNFLAHFLFMKINLHTWCPFKRLHPCENGFALFFAFPHPESASFSTSCPSALVCVEVFSFKPWFCHRKGQIHGGKRGKGNLGKGKMRWETILNKTDVSQKGIVGGEHVFLVHFFSVIIFCVCITTYLLFPLSLVLLNNNMFNWCTINSTDNSFPTWKLFRYIFHCFSSFMLKVLHLVHKVCKLFYESKNTPKCFLLRLFRLNDTSTIISRAEMISWLFQWVQLPNVRICCFSLFYIILNWVSVFDCLSDKTRLFTCQLVLWVIWYFTQPLHI